MSWKPIANLAALRYRAELLRDIREFFSARKILEIETPLLSAHTATDPSLGSFCVEGGGSSGTSGYLQTSPEHAMKRLLAMQGEPVFQICKAFREGEAGPRHNPEFTLLEWYRPGLDDRALMQEVAELVCTVLGRLPEHTFRYRELFLQQLSIDPHDTTCGQLRALAQELVDCGDLGEDKDAWLDLLMTHVIEPTLPTGHLCFVCDYPASQAALAKVESVEGKMIARRFELYVNGMELANGYFELTDAPEQRRRFELDNQKRREQGLTEVPLDENLLAAMKHGLPECSGVALGVDRLLMLAMGAADIREVLAFPWDNA